MRVLLAGATGYIGQAVLRELMAQGHEVVALVRPGRRLSLALSDHKPNATPDELSDAVTVVEAEITSDEDWTSPLPNTDVVVSCLASRSGAPADARLVEYEANRRLLAYAERAAVQHFVLLSAICVQMPRLAFQREKLKFEALLDESSVPATIIRATAFFRSLVGQVERVRAGKPFLLFSSGNTTACKPISDRDLARFIVSKLESPPSATAVLPIGGPGPALTPQDQGRLLCETLGQPFRTTSLPPEMFDWIRWLISPLALVSQRMRDRMEFLRIAKFYATESMLCWDATAERYDAEATPEFGDDTLQAFYAGLASGEFDMPERGEHSLF
jgi:divinyl chlorophyllide a 8-vinyl-reductase